MKLLATIYLIIVTFIAYGQPTPSDCTLSPSFVDRYRRDITQLATYRLFQVSSTDTESIKVPKIAFDSVATGFAAIYNATDLPVRDSVFKLYCVHNLNGFPFAYAGLLVRVDLSYTWAKAWEMMNQITGNSLVDGLTARYHLRLTNFYHWSIGTYAELATDSSWNILALVDSFKLIPGIMAAQQNGLTNVAGTITYNVSDSFRYYYFDFEFDDCFDGCDAYRRWAFKVDKDCNVYYLGYFDWGYWGIQPLPAPTYCTAQTDVISPAKKRFRVSPNPAIDKVTIIPDGQPLRNITVSVYNTIGSVVKTTELAANSTLEIDISSLPSGVYLLVMRTQDGIWQQRFLKL